MRSTVTLGRMEALLAVVLGCAATFFVFGTGWSSADSLYQYLQASGRMRLDDAHPPLMALLWRVTDMALPGSAGLYALFVVAWWSGLVATLWQLPGARVWRWGALVVVGCWPAAFLMLGHVWKDVGMVGALLLGVAATLRWHGGGGWRVFVAALCALTVACGFRHNAVFGAWPLLVWLCWPRSGMAAARRKAALVLLASTAVLLLTPAAIARLSGAVRGDAWTLVALWDIGAVSVAQDRMLLPPSIHLPDLTVAELRAGYVPWANPPLFGSGKIVLSLYVSYTDAQRADVLRAWWRAIATFPRDYLAHRAALARHLLFGYDAALPFQLVYVPERLDVGGEPRLVPIAGDAPAVQFAHRLHTTPLFAGALYLGLAAVACFGALRPARRAFRPAVLALAASAWCNTLALFLVAGSAEFRYLLWSVLASLLACVIACWPVPSARDERISAA